MLTLDDLHDATLTRTEIMWATGDLRFDFKVDIQGMTDVSLLATGLKFLEIPRQFPWGKSISLNRVEAKMNGQGCMLSLEMQSGDVIVATVDSFYMRSNASQANPKKFS